MLRLLFPPKCVLCRRILSGNESDLCHPCRKDAPAFSRAKSNIPFIAHWTALWYYKDDVRKSIQRFKFGNRRNYAAVYSRLLALRLLAFYPEPFDVLTWVPVSALRKLKRGYDQSALLAKATGQELGVDATPVLRKIRHTPPQSLLRDASQRRANVLGAYAVSKKADLSGKRILLLDDVITTGATASECAKMLLSAGAKEVCFAAVAAASHDKNK
jgi:ComF family protein